MTGLHFTCKRQSTNGKLSPSPAHSAPILSHVYAGRPLSAAHLLPLYLAHPAPRPSVMYLGSSHPGTLVFSLRHASSELLLLATSSSEMEPLLALEFLHRVADALEDFLGAPLSASRIEAGYEVAAQLLTEMCDAGTVCLTEPNALRDLVEVEGWVGKLLGSINLPAAVGVTGGGAGSGGVGSRLGGGIGGGGIGGGRGGAFSTHHGNSSAPSLGAISSTSTPALPWRRANVRHTSNELYADVVESLCVTLAPSGRPVAAFAHGTILFTSKVSGVPDILLCLATPAGGRHNIADIIELPLFHPCVRLARWRDRPGELSFIPPDGRFVLASYEVDLLPFTGRDWPGGAANKLRLPVGVEMKTSLGPTGAEFEVRLQINRNFGGSSGHSSGPSSRGASTVGSRQFGGPQPGTQASPSLEDVSVRVPLPADVRNLPDIRPSRGDATYNPGDRCLEWTIPAKAIASGTTHFTLRCTVAGMPTATAMDEDGDEDPTGFGFGREYEYHAPYQSEASSGRKEWTGGGTAEGGGAGEDEREARRIEQNKMLMPSSASVSFSVKGWLASGIKVESITIDPRRSRGLGEGVKPFKGVKYLTVSKGGLEVRC